MRITGATSSLSSLHRRLELGGGPTSEGARSSETRCRGRRRHPAWEAQTADWQVGMREYCSREGGSRSYASAVGFLAGALAPSVPAADRAVEEGSIVAGLGSAVRPVEPAPVSRLSSSFLTRSGLEMVVGLVEDAVTGCWVPRTNMLVEWRGAAGGGVGCCCASSTAGHRYIPLLPLQQLRITHRTEHSHRRRRRTKQFCS